MSMEYARQYVQQSTVFAIVATLLATLIASACVSTPPTGTVANRAEAGAHARGTNDELNILYDAAIVDSAIYRVDRQSNQLWPITGSTAVGSFISCYQCTACYACRTNPAEGSDNGSACPMCSTCSSKCVEPGPQPAPSDIWVSPLRQIESFCKTFAADDVVLRMQQLQGLPPNLDQPSDSWKFLLLSLQGPDQLFRPCANDDPTTPGPCLADFGPEATEQLEAWIAGQALSSWQLPQGYPWTRQGYTYNWNPNAPSIVGTSEYVIPQGTLVNVDALVNAVDYCTQLNN